MDGMILLRQAREAGLVVQRAGNQLVIRGPKRAAPVAELLINNKPQVMAVLALARTAVVVDKVDAAWWRREYRVRTLHRLVTARTLGEAEVLAWGDLQNRWHRSHGKRVPSGQCAGCDQPIGGLPSFDLGDGNRVHLERLGCLIRYGDRWRSAATRALLEFGLKLPDNAIGNSGDQETDHGSYQHDDPTTAGGGDANHRRQ